MAEGHLTNDDMSLETLLFHFAFAMILFLTSNWIGAHSYSYGYVQLTLIHQHDDAPIFNLTYRILAPIVFMVLVSAGLYAAHLDYYVANIYLIPIFHGLLRLAVNLGLGRFRLLNWRREAFVLVAVTGSAVFIYKKLVINKTALLPNFDTLSNELWLIVFAFIYATLNKVQLDSGASIARRENYIRACYSKFHSRYERILSGLTKNEQLKALIYSVMIYENFNRPAITRALERLTLIFRRPRTLGVMQIRSMKNISDRDSVRLGAKKLIDDWEFGFRKDLPKKISESSIKDEQFRRAHAKRQVLRDVISKYNGGTAYETEIIYVYREVLRQFYPSLKVDLPW